ncbi:MAG: methionyl-tRNA formyltransferase [Myxococcota bacterium]
MRVIFMGTPDFAVPTLSALHEAGHDIALVVAQPDRPAGRGQKLTKPPVAARALELGLPLSQPRAIHAGRFAERYTGLEADVAVVIAYGRILGALHLQSPRYGAVNLHASLLPRWRGAAPIQAALLAGDPETGVCAQRMEEGLDTGDLYVERRLPIDPHETAGTLHDKLAALSAEVAVETLAGLPGLVPKPQSHDGICWAPKIDKVDGLLHLSESAVALDRRIRAMTPWPGGWIAGEAGPLKIREARRVDATGPAGTVLSTRPLVVATGEGALELESVQAPGKKPVSGTDFANGFRLAVGDPLWV